MSTETLNTIDLVFTKIFNVPIELVWKAWSDPEYIMQWWGPNGFTCPLAKLDFRDGGISIVCMNSPEYGDMYSTWRYREIIPMKQIDFVHNLSDKSGNKIDPVSIGMPPDFPQDLVYIIIFEELSDTKTKLTITEFNWPVGQMMEMSKIGMEQCLDKMLNALTQIYQV